MATSNPKKTIRLGMVGGGQGAFIGAVHRIASRIDNRFKLVAGALSSNPERALASGRELGLDDDRSYTDYKEMARHEADLKDGIEAVAIVTPNHLHAPIASAFLSAGIHVICDKPLTTNLDEAIDLEKKVHQSKKLFILTHNYTGYPVIRQAREIIANGTLGNIRIVRAEYAQDWLTEAADDDNKQATWRSDPKMAGSGAIGDIGTHAFNLANFVSGLETEQLSAELSRFVPNRQLDDNAHINIRYKGGARGTIWASQVAPGNENSLTLRIYGEKGGLEWSQEDPNYLWHTPFGEPKRLITRSGNGASDIANRVSRVPGGHPEGYLEGFATIYSEAAIAIEAYKTGASLPEGHHINTIEDGVYGMKFIDACQRSSINNASWVSL
ncbi:Gfo/Idh/MocA family protein [Lentilitoribacter sp. EG35]|uniref:Gfo/Idh/MocA family protein n=1 Tax=Lentilitoribacter sp. EG35 TaxID=3234192 RepID=UPI00346022D3